jgi:hypothetical protein
MTTTAQLTQIMFYRELLLADPIMTVRDVDQLQQRLCLPG